MPMNEYLGNNALAWLNPVAFRRKACFHIPPYPFPAAAAIPMNRDSRVDGCPESATGVKHR